MGNTCPGSTHTHKGKFEKHDAKTESQPSSMENQEEEDESNWTEDHLNAQLDELMKAMQEHHFRRLKKELESDINTFILNNLLMSIQFYENFDRAKDTASQFKKDKESEMNDRLAQAPLEGMILGERRTHLLHGMPHVLAQNYVYRPPNNANEEEFFGNHFFGSDPKNTFMSEGILPLEFLMTWDNLELYQNTDWDMLQSKLYSSAKGVLPTFRFCMEEPANNNEVPRGYIRLRSVDVTEESERIRLISERTEYDYAGAAGFSDKVSEAMSGSDTITISESSESGTDIDIEEFNKSILGSRSYLRTAAGLSSSSSPVSKRPKSPIPQDTEQKSHIPQEIPRAKLVERRNSGLLPTNYPRLGKPSRLAEKSTPLYNSEPHLVPSVEIHPATPDATTGAESFSPPSFPTSVSPSRDKKINVLSKSLNALNGNGSSSGYDTLDSAGISRSSSVTTVASEEIRFKWRQVELKQLVQYPLKNRALSDMALDKQAPISNECFECVEAELSSEEEDEADDENEGSEDSDSYKAIDIIKRDLRYYLNSTLFSSQFCTEFHYIGVKSGLPPDSINHAVVLGTTIRCMVEHGSDDDCYSMTHTFTPGLQSKYWPRNYYFWFNQRMFQKQEKKDLGLCWPSQEQVELIEKLGTNSVPLGFRSIKFFNKHQSLEWQMNFLPAETVLMNSFHSVHWRAYLFMGLIFRAFIAPLGPQGIGMEHIRNVLYFMCHQDFIGWNDEQPGVHVRAVLDKLYDCLGKGKMPNFFIQNQNLLKTIPAQNSRLVQGHLGKVRDNMVIYCIYALRNLTCMKTEGKYYPMPNLKKLYDVITIPDKGLLQMHNPGLGLSSMPMPDEDNRKKVPRKKKVNLDLIENEDFIETEFRLIGNRPPRGKDKMQERLRKKRAEYDQKMRQLAREQRSRNFAPDAKIPVSERRKSIDLKQSPVIPERFSRFRKALVIEFFIKHFIKMAKKCNEFRAYSNSAMYIMHVENLCAILLDDGFNLGQTTMDEETVEEYLKQCQVLREVVGRDMRNYATSRFSHLNLPTLTNQTNTVFGEWTASTSKSNWELKIRRLPSLPLTSNESEEILDNLQSSKPRLSGQKQFITPDMTRTLQSLQTIPSTSPASSQPPSAKLPRRAESIKFVDKPKMLKKTNSRQSIKLEDDLEYSTYL